MLEKGGVHWYALVGSPAALDDQEGHKSGPRFAPVPGGRGAGSDGGRVFAPVRLRGGQRIAARHRAAVAMGFAVDDTVDLPSGYLPRVVDHHEQWRWPVPYRRYADLLQRSTTLAAVAEAHRVIWTRIVQTVRDGDKALVIGHGGGIEPAMVACLPEADHKSWGAPFAHCDGARLSFDHDRFVGIQFHRVDRTSRAPS